MASHLIKKCLSDIQLLSEESNDSELVEESKMNQNKPWRVYITESIRTKHFYAGISNDPDKRLMDHNAGIRPKFAVDQGPLKLVYLSPAYEGKSEARKREIQLKKWRREKKIWLIEGKIL